MHAIPAKKNNPAAIVTNIAGSAKISEPNRISPNPMLNNADAIPRVASEKIFEWNLNIALLSQKKSGLVSEPAMDSISNTSRRPEALREIPSFQGSR